MVRKSKWPVIGHTNIKKFLHTSIKSKRLAHAYIFVGAEGIGKSKVADWFIKSLLCQQSGNDELEYPCLACEQCLQAENGVHPDIIKVSKDGQDKNLGIDQVRLVVEKLALKSFIAKYKIALLMGAESLREEGANALLKTLEEPSGQTVIILLANNLSTLPSTIISRCQIVKFSPVNHDILLDYLLENTKLDKTTAENMVRLSLGLPERLETWANNSQEWENYKMSIKHKLKSIEQPLYMNILSGRDTFKQAKSFNEKIEILANELDEWAYILRDMLLIKTGNINLINNYFIINSLEKAVHRFSLDKIKEMLNWLIIARNSLRSNPNPNLTIENFFITINN